MKHNNPRKIDNSERKRKILLALAETLEWFTMTDIAAASHISKDNTAECVEHLMRDEMVACSVVTYRKYYAITRRGLNAIKTETTDE